MKWIDTNKDLPKFSEEYLVVWDLDDCGPPVVTSMDFNVKEQSFFDPRGVEENPVPMKEILLWGELPKAPKRKKKKSTKPEVPPVSIDEMERRENKAKNK